MKQSILILVIVLSVFSLRAQDYNTSMGVRLGFSNGLTVRHFLSSKIPFNISFDYKPGFNLVGHKGFWGDEFALSLRYTLK